MSIEIKRIRKILGLSQEKFAEAISREQGINITPSCIGNYENNFRNPLIPNAMAITNFAKSKGIDTSLEKIYKEKIPQSH